MRFWDTSAVIPLLIAEPTHESAMSLLRSDVVIVTWWGTSIECVSAIARREREASLSAAASSAATARLNELAGEWAEVQPTDSVRVLAQRLLRVHPLRAADAQQLAAALVAAEGDASSLPFVCLDERLNEAALREGLPLNVPN